MALESGSFISDLIITNPTGADAKSTADDHLRLIKSVVKTTFPSITGAVTPTHTVLNFVAGVTSAIQAQIDAKAALTSPALTGTPTAPTAAVGTANTQLASTSFVATAIASVNTQTALVVAIVALATQTAAAGTHYVMTNAAVCTLTLPAAPASGDTVWVTFTNGLAKNTIASNGKTIMALAEDMTVDLTAGLTVELRYVNTDWRLV